VEEEVEVDMEIIIVVVRTEHPSLEMA